MELSHIMRGEALSMLLSLYTNSNSGSCVPTN